MNVRTTGRQRELKRARGVKLELIKLFKGRKIDIRKNLDWNNDIYKGAGYGSSFVREFTARQGRPPTVAEQKAETERQVGQRFSDPLNVSHYGLDSYRSILQYTPQAPEPAPHLRPDLAKKDPLAALQTPILFATGEHDRTIRPDFVRKVYERSTSPGKELVIVPDGYHQLLLHNTGEFLPSVERFFHKHLGRST
jgi:pimeloyl-ACP methyl ester carboxylesterase